MSAITELSHCNIDIDINIDIGMNINIDIDMGVGMDMDIDTGMGMGVGIDLDPLVPQPFDVSAIITYTNVINCASVLLELVGLLLHLYPDHTSHLTPYTMTNNRAGFDPMSYDVHLLGAGRRQWCGCASSSRSLTVLSASL